MIMFILSAVCLTLDLMLSRENRCWATRQNIETKVALCWDQPFQQQPIWVDTGWHFSTEHFSNHFWLRRSKSWEWFLRELQSGDMVSQTGFLTVATWFETGWKSWSTKPTETSFLQYNTKKLIQPESVDLNRTRPKSG